MQMYDKTLPWHMAKARKVALLPFVMASEAFQTFMSTWRDVFRYVPVENSHSRGG